jgi:hypothetical protein
LFRYLDEQTFRYNERKMADCKRFQTVLGSISRKRLTWNKSDLSEGRVTSTPETRDKGAAEDKGKPRRTPGFGKFEKLLKQVVNAPPLRNKAENIRYST